MRLRPLFAAVIFAFALGACSGGDSHEKVVDDIATQMDRVATAMSAVQDQATAERAVADMKSIVEEMKKIAPRAQALGEPGGELKARLAAKMKAKEADLQKKIAGSQAAMVKAGPEAAGIIMKGMAELAPTLGEMSALFDEAEAK